MTWLDITGLTPGQVRMLESDEQAGTPDVLLFEAPRLRPVPSLAIREFAYAPESYDLRPRQRLDTSRVMSPLGRGGSSSCDVNAPGLRRVPHSGNGRMTLPTLVISR